ncbi:MAG: hypothetical protein M1347_04370 [Chloroflexi bacterium]|nr:hypothetical protein [Chloroflexota bacterium]
MGERMQDDQLAVGELDGRGKKLPNPPTENRKKRLQRKPTTFERRVEARAMDQVTKALEERLDQPALTDSAAGSPEEQAPVSGPEDAESESDFAQALRLLQAAGVGSHPRVLRLLADLAELAQGEAPTRVARASHIIQPSGGGLPAPDLRGEYEKRLAALRPCDVAGLMDLKREFRKRGLEVY